MQRDAISWIEEGKVVACAYPRSDADWQRLKAAGVTLVVNLHEAAHDEDTLAKYGLQSVHIPVKDFSAPTQDQLEFGTHTIRQALQKEQVVAAHCGAGLGRTGTLMACRLVDAGAAASPQEAIDRVRKCRPGSVETSAQEEAVEEFAQTKKKK